MWVQDASSLRLFRDVALTHSGKVPICPLVDVSYSFNYIDSSEFSRYAKIWYEDTYGKTVAATYANRAVLSSGLFAMEADNSLWEAWAKEVDSVLRRNYSSHASFHLSEQTAFNYLLYANDQFVPLEAIHKYNCHVGRIMKDHDGCVVISDAPNRRVGVVHFTYSSKLIGHYIQNGLLFQAGAYLSAEELSRLRTLDHY